MLIFKNNHSLTVSFEDRVFSFEGPKAEEVYSNIEKMYPNEEHIFGYLLNYDREADEVSVDAEDIMESEVLVLKGMSVYLRGGAEVSMPQDLVVKILNAERVGNHKELTKYINFWTLVCLNPDSRVRNNIFWYLRRWEVEIAPSGLIIAYRNADLKKSEEFTINEVKYILRSYYNKVILHGENDPELTEKYHKIIDKDTTPVYTDHHSGTTTIKLGQPVRIPREECDPVQEHTCSNGLHVASAGWLSSNYYGNVGLQVLVNPANVVAVPPEDGYGKMRCCEYFPIALVDFDDAGNVIVPDYDISNDFAYIEEIQYDGKVNNEDIDQYKIKTGKSLTNNDIYSDILARMEDEL